MNCHTIVIAGITVFFTVGPLGSRAHAQSPLRLEQVYESARSNNARVRAALALTDAKQALESGAGLLPDPNLEIGAMNLSLPSLAATMPSSMAPSIQLMQMVPLFGKLSLNQRIAQQTTSIAKADAAETWWEVRAEAGMSFFEVYQADREITAMTQTLKLLEDFRKVAQAMYSAGEGRQADVLRASVEIARMQAEITRIQAMRTAAVARLNEVMNRPAETPINAVEFPDLPATVPTTDTLRVWAESARPMLERGRTEVAQAGSRAALAKKEIWPDITIGLQYGQRRAAMSGADAALPPEYSTERMGSITLGFSVPLYAGKRQLKMRDEAAAMRQMAQADLTKMQAAVDAGIVELTAHLEHNRTLVKLYNNEVLPQAEANVQSAFASYRVGQVDFMTLVDAQMSVNKYKQELAALVADYGVGISELEMTIGRALPVTEALRAEGK